MVCFKGRAGPQSVTSKHIPGYVPFLKKLSKLVLPSTSITTTAILHCDGIFFLLESFCKAARKHVLMLLLHSATCCSRRVTIEVDAAANSSNYNQQVRECGVEGGGIERQWGERWKSTFVTGRHGSRKSWILLFDVVIGKMNELLS